MESKFLEFQEQLQNQMAVMFEKDLFSPLAGRIFCRLLFAPDSLSLQEIAQDLSVTKAAVSVQVRMLQRLGFCERLSRPNDRRDYYQISGSFSEKALDLVLERTRTTISDVDRALAAFPPRDQLLPGEERAYEFGMRQFTEIRMLHQMLWERIADMQQAWQERYRRLSGEEDGRP